MKYLLEKINNTRSYLLMANIILVFFLILLSNLKILPLGSVGDFLFLTFLFLAFALYRPGWAFLFFIGTIMLENINLAPENIGIAVRPYQFFAALTILAVLIRLAAKRLNFKLPKFLWIDGAVIIFALAGFISALGSEASKLAFKQSLVALSFVAIYFLVRIFVQNLEDLKKIIPFFLSSSIIVVLYGIWQNVRFSHGLSSFETMPGRPNGTFTEPDWYGIFLVFLLAVIYSIIYFLLKNNAGEKPVIFKIFSYIILTAIYTILILTVSRSAWFGALIVTVSYLLIIFTNLKLNPKNWQWKDALKIKLQIISSIIMSVAIVYFFNLTAFQLFSRFQSTGTGQQKITISCWSQKCSENECIQREMPPVENIKTIDELEKYGCRHINLEDINKEKLSGNVIMEIYRPDPNISIRGDIYQKSWQQIKTHPILGIGWGNIGEILGRDGRGVILNSSNLFLEIWLGAGALGLLAFLAALIFIFINGIKNFQTDTEKKFFGLFLILGFFALIIPNLFNAGIFLGFLWIFLALGNIKENA